MNFDFNLTITGIIALIALISPIITSFIDNRYKLKRENIQNYELAKRLALENFIKCANNYIRQQTSLNTAQFDTSLNNLYLYFSKIPDSIHTLKNTNLNDFEKNLNKIVIQLSKQIKKK